MANNTVQIQIRVAWWVKWYLYGVALTCQITGMDFDEAKVGRYIRRGLKACLSERPIE